MKSKSFLILQPLLKRNLLVILLIITGVVLSNCSGGTGANDNNQKENIHTLIVGGGSSHDFDRWYKQADAETLREGGLANVTYTDNTDSIIHYLPDMDVLYLSNNQPINDPAVRQAIFDFVKDGNGLILGHAALWYNWSDWPEYNTQLVSGGSRGHDPYGEFNVKVTNSDHPVTENVDQNFTLKDELYYYKTDPSGPGVEVLATASAEGSDESFPSVFVVKHNEGRIVGLALGHDAESHNLPAYQTILKNAVKWAAKE
jgi:type 1 glutamine amidotransferase